jgi:hypothetical protein
MNHPTVACSYFGESVDLDVEIAPLLRDIWKLGIGTTESCQDSDPDATAEITPPEGDEPARVVGRRTVPEGEGMVYISFDHDHVQRFLDVVSAGAEFLDDQDDEDDPLGESRLYWRIAPWEKLTFDHPKRWRYSTSVYRTAPDYRVRLRTAVWFPRPDLPIVEHIFREAVKAHRGEESELFEG